jgi:hypothetical protein
LDRRKGEHAGEHRTFDVGADLNQVVAGANHDYSLARGDPFVVSL